MSANEKSATPPVWLIAGVAAVVVLLAGFFIWGQVMHDPTGGIPDKKVQPNMYDFRKSAQEGTLGRRADPK